MKNTVCLGPVGWLLLAAGAMLVCSLASCGQGATSNAKDRRNR